MIRCITLTQEADADAACSACRLFCYSTGRRRLLQPETGALDWRVDRSLLDQSSLMIVTPEDAVSAGLHVLPGTFAGLMDLYERNYIGIRRLIPRMPPAATCQVSRLPTGLSLYLQVLERFRYTTELTLTYHFVRASGVAAEPALQIRVYHDARLAEVMSAQLRHGPDFQLSEDAPQQNFLSARWHVNRFLYKWLNYCLYQGHRFGADSQPA